MIGERDLDRLRCAAALLGLAPELSVRVRSGDQVVFEAMRPPFPLRDHRLVPACGFHRGVARALELQRAGTEVELCGIEDGATLGVDLGCRGSTRVLPAGLVRVRSDDRERHLFALAQPVEEVVDAIGELDDVPDIQLHADRDLDATVCVTSTPAGDAAAANRAVYVLHTVAARATVHRISSLLEAGALC